MSVLLTLLSLPLELPNPRPTEPPGGIGDKVTQVLGVVMWAVAAVCLGAAIIAGGRIAMAHRRGEEGEGFKALLMAILGLVVATSAASILTWVIN